VFQFKRDFEEYFCGARPIAGSKAPNPELQTFDIWLSRNKTKIPVE
jgi:hypothetical protein